VGNILLFYSQIGATTVTSIHQGDGRSGRASIRCFLSKFSYPGKLGVNGPRQAAVASPSAVLGDAKMAV
jgi:hypothetical protein